MAVVTKFSDPLVCKTRGIWFETKPAARYAEKTLLAISQRTIRNRSTLPCWFDKRENSNNNSAYQSMGTTTTTSLISFESTLWMGSLHML